MTDEMPEGRDVPSASDRRTFLRRLSAQAIEGAGRLGGMSQTVRRSLEAAGDAAADELAPAPPASTAVSDTRPAPAVAGQAAPAVAPQPPPREAPPSPPSLPRLSAQQEAHLGASRSAVLAVNDAAGAPHLTVSWFHWDGNVIRLPTGFFTARATNIERDPRVSVVVASREDGAWVSITGEAAIVAGPAAYDEALALLAKYLPAEDPAAAWQRLNPSDDGAIVIVRPVRFLWRTG